MADVLAVKHEERRLTRADGGDTLSVCYCGASWTHQHNRTEAEMDSIFESHVKYFNNKTVVL